MAVAAKDKQRHKQYAQYAAHCLNLVPVITAQEYRAVQREMAAEWLKLVEASLHSPRRPQTQKK